MPPSLACVELDLLTDFLFSFKDPLKCTFAKSAEYYATYAVCHISANTNPNKPHFRTCRIAVVASDV